MIDFARVKIKQQSEFIGALVLILGKMRQIRFNDIWHIMADSFSHTHTFTLDKQHFIECFEQTSRGDYSWKAYFKSMILLGFGIAVVLFTDINQYTAWFVFALGVLEVLSVRYQKPWWVTRQMLSKASNSEVTITIDEKSLTCKSAYIDSTVKWSDIKEIEITALGFVINDGKSRFYVANKGLSGEAISFINKKSRVIANQSGAANK